MDGIGKRRNPARRSNRVFNKVESDKPDTKPSSFLSVTNEAGPISTHATGDEPPRFNLSSVTTDRRLASTGRRSVAASGDMRRLSLAGVKRTPQPPVSAKRTVPEGQTISRVISCYARPTLNS